MHIARELFLQTGDGDENGKVLIFPPFLCLQNPVTALSPGVCLSSSINFIVWPLPPAMESTCLEALWREDWQIRGFSESISNSRLIVNLPVIINTI